MRDNPGDKWLRWWFDGGIAVVVVRFGGEGAVAQFGPRVREQTGQRRRPLYLHARLNHRGEGAGAARAGLACRQAPRPRSPQRALGTHGHSAATLPALRSHRSGR